MSNQESTKAGDFLFRDNRVPGLLIDFFEDEAERDSSCVKSAGELAVNFEGARKQDWKIKARTLVVLKPLVKKK